ncbi:MULTISPECIES: Zn-ribbon domain-containing OB-fold protein [unclassified Streptomyces]|uniref:Zn-ribbon domain-containing OB-fold protein n=1 Tax=unclassified Streptomyces TaxID=2593676 RepID=UPI0038142441
MIPHDQVLTRLEERLADDRLELPRCTDCGTLVWYPRPRCPHCMSDSLIWEALSGNGTVHSYTVNHRGQGEYAGRAPFVIAYVELAEGPRVLSHVDAEPDSLRVGMPVRLSRGLDLEGRLHLRFERAEENS